MQIRLTQTWVVTRHQYGISAFVSQTSFRGETSGDLRTKKIPLNYKKLNTDFCRFFFSLFLYIYIKHEMENGGQHTQLLR